MKAIKKAIGIIAVVSLVAFACKSSHSVPVKSTTEGQVKTSQPTAKELYANKCARCHKLFSPEKFSNEKWNKVVARMATRAKLTEEEKILILSLAVN